MGDFREETLAFWNLQKELEGPRPRTTVATIILDDSRTIARTSSAMNTETWNKVESLYLEIFNKWGKIESPWRAAGQGAPPFSQVMIDLQSFYLVGGVAGTGMFNTGLFGGKLHSNWLRITVPTFAMMLTGAPPVAPPPPAPVVIDGVTIDPNLTYTATIFSKATGEIVSSGIFNGSDLIRLLDTNVRIELGISTGITREPTLTPQNPFITDIFTKEKIQQTTGSLTVITLKERLTIEEEAFLT